MPKRRWTQGRTQARLPHVQLERPRDRRRPGEGLAPILIHVGSEEALLGDALMIADAAGQARVSVRLEIWPEMIHVWHAFAGQLKAGRRAVAQAGAWMADRFET